MNLRELFDALQTNDAQKAHQLMFPTQPVLCYIDPTLPIVSIARALASEGFCLKNDDRGNLMITRLEGYEPPVKPIEPTQEQIDSDLFDGAWDGTGIATGDEDLKPCGCGPGVFRDGECDFCGREDPSKGEAK